MPAAKRDPLRELLAGEYPDPEGGEMLGTSVRSVAIEDSLRGREVALVETLRLGERLAVVGDDATFAALGDRVASALSARFAVRRISLGHRPHADEEALARLLRGLSGDGGEGVDAVVAVGSGTINDLCKLAAKSLGVPQVVFATAPSMNGYTSVSASIVEAGLKRSIRASAPVGVFFDLEVLARAPARLIRAGLGDSLCRPTAQADWLLAHLLLDEPYRQAPFSLLAADEEVLLAEPAALLSGSLPVMRSLARTLVLSGFGMTLCNGSYPASQGEHLISHYAEMMGMAAAVPSFHGEQIGVTALAMARLQRAMLAQDEAPALGATRIEREDLIAHYGAALGEGCWRDVQGKCFAAPRAIELRNKLAASWPAIRARIAAVARSPEQLEQALAAAGAPTTPAQLGWSETAFATAVRRARQIRNRYTFLDLAIDSGVDPVAAMLP
jgi:glycerol-1-phosphate dehydrogenase [NAD(P)+]